MCSRGIVRFVVCGAVALMACGPPDAYRPVETEPPVVAPAAVGEGIEPKTEVLGPEAEPEVPPPLARQDEYALTPITPFALAVTDLVLDVLAGRPLETDLPVERTAAPVEPLELGPGVEEIPEDLEPVGFLAEMDFTVEPDSPVGRVTAEVFLGAGGMRVVGLGYAPGIEEGHLPEAMGGFEPLAARILSALREEDRGLLEELVPRAVDRPWIGDDLYAELTRGWTLDVLDREPPLDLDGLEPVSWQIDRLTVFLRAPDETLYTAELDVDPGTFGQLELDTRPLVRFERGAR